MVQTQLDAGRLTAKLLLQAPIDTSDGQGGVMRTWSDVSSLWAAIRPLTVSRDEVASAERVTALFDIWLYMRSDIVVGMRLIQQARIFTVLSSRSSDESHRFLILRCVEEKP
jgi:SPP1 family predicted phage head-tail adaptor